MLQYVTVGLECYGMLRLHQFLKARHSRFLAACDKVVKAAPALKPTAVKELKAILAERVLDSNATKGLRLDGSFVLDGPNRHNIHIVTDHGTTHHSNRSTLESTKSDLIARHKAELNAIATGLAFPSNQAPTKPVDNRIKDKKKRYAPLITVMEAQFYCRQRQVKPILLVPIISNAGEFSPDVFALVEQLAKAYHRTYLGAQRPIDGYTASQATAVFRTRLKDSLAVCVANGYAVMLRCSAAAVGQIDF
jgi:hypothetical protein